MNEPVEVPVCFLCSFIPADAAVYYVADQFVCVADWPAFLYSHNSPAGITVITFCLVRIVEGRDMWFMVKSYKTKANIS